jgi:hypothetical protein
VNLTAQVSQRCLGLLEITPGDKMQVTLFGESGPQPLHLGPRLVTLRIGKGAIISDSLHLGPQLGETFEQQCYRAFNRRPCLSLPFFCGYAKCLVYLLTQSHVLSSKRVSAGPQLVPLGLSLLGAA